MYFIYLLIIFDSNINSRVRLKNIFGSRGWLQENEWSRKRKFCGIRRDKRGQCQAVGGIDVGELKRAKATAQTTFSYMYNDEEMLINYSLKLVRLSMNDVEIKGVSEELIG